MPRVFLTLSGICSPPHTAKTTCQIEAQLQTLVWFDARNIIIIHPCTFVEYSVQPSPFTWYLATPSRPTARQIAPHISARVDNGVHL